MYKFHYDYSKNKYSNNSILLFTDSDDFMYETKTADIYEDFSQDKQCLISVIILMIQTN